MCGQKFFSKISDVRESIELASEFFTLGVRSKVFTENDVEIHRNQGKLIASKPQVILFNLAYNNFLGQRLFNVKQLSQSSQVSTGRTVLTDQIRAVINV